MHHTLSEIVILMKWNCGSLYCKYEVVQHKMDGYSVFYEVGILKLNT